jgi:hypothetical protein
VRVASVVNADVDSDDLSGARNPFGPELSAKSA